MARSGDVNTHSFPTRCLRSAGKNDPSRRLGIVRSASLASVGLARGLAHELGDHPGPAAAERAVLWWADVACRDARRRGRVHATWSGVGSTVTGMQQTRAAPPATTLDAVLERITYANQETGYTVARVATDRSADLLTVVGPLLGAQPGERLRLRGRWRSHPQYGRQFEVETYQTVLPATIQGIRRYLGSGLIKGIGPRMAERIVDHFGQATLQVIEQQPGRLVEVPGLGPKRTGMITAAWAEQQAIKEVMVFLQGVGVSTSLGVRIYKTYRDEAINVVRREPYRLAADVWGIGFKTADTIAQSLGIPHDSTDRVKAGLQAALTPTQSGLAERRFGGRVYRVGDKVMQIRNNYDKGTAGVFNGSVGVVTALSLEDQEMRVLLDEDEEVAYGFDELDELTHAYAVSIHRSQGSEYPCVVIPLTTGAWLMLQRNLLYTAVTRAKRIVVLVGSRRALAKAVRTQGAGRRYTALAERLRGGTG